MKPTAAMTRARLAEAIARETGVTRRDAILIVEVVFEAIVEALASGEEVEIRGFGSFRLRYRPARMARNPRTGQPVAVPAKRVPFFRPGRDLRVGLNPKT